MGDQIPNEYEKIEDWTSYGFNHNPTKTTFDNIEKEEKQKDKILEKRTKNIEIGSRRIRFKNDNRTVIPKLVFDLKNDQIYILVI